MATATDDNAADEKSDKSIWQLLNIRCTSYGNRIRAKYTAKWGVQIAGMLFQTRSRVYFVKEDISMEIPVVIVYMIGQKYIVGGMTSGAVKE